jgi:UDP-N-acetylmuramyl-tripeptide synthetase
VTAPELAPAAGGAVPVVQWLRQRVPARAHLRLDSRQVEPGDVFFAVAGRRTDGATYVASALARGAAAILVDDEAVPAALLAPGTNAGAAPPILAVHGLRPSLGAIAAEYYGHPTAALQPIGITGTNGKTSSCIWLAQVLAAAGLPCATLGTLGFGLPGALRGGDSTLTTPDALSVQRLAREALDSGARRLAMEVSSIGLDQGRVDGVDFAVALFTNLTRDHLDYHADMAAYAAAKRTLFFWPGLRHAVLNLDDAFGRELAGVLARQRGPRRTTVIGVGTRAANDPQIAALALDVHLQARDIRMRSDGLRFTLECRRMGGTGQALAGGEPLAQLGALETADLDTSVLGDFNVANLLGVVGAALACGLRLADAAGAAARLQAPPGRLQRVASEAAPMGAGGAIAIDEPLAVVDYAHTPDAIAKALQALRPVAQARNGRLWIVFGAGGDRDRGKRPAMAAAAAAADAIVLTSDNPRSEDADSIIDQVAAGIPPGFAWSRHVDRGAGIRAALHAAATRDVVLIAGKGHENTQEIAGQRLPFSDVAMARAALRERLDGAA